MYKSLFPSFDTPSDVPSDEVAKQPVLSLFELNSMVRSMLRYTMPECYWLAAEISELSVASNGHCYLSFVQKDEMSGVLVAKARANIWRDKYLMLSSRFYRGTGQRLTYGLKVLVCVTVTFHELYGYSLNVIDVDPAYTLGELERRRREIIRQLDEDGVTNLNKELPLPRIIRRVAVVSSGTAAGYGDFCNQLSQSGFAFDVKLFQATMQGDTVEQSVIAALDRIAAESEKWDVVAIIRGGGATTDLNGFDSYLLAANIAQFPLPVLTGIGHERDNTIADLVAHTRLKTPTAVAAFLVDTRREEAAVLKDLEQRLMLAVHKRCRTEHTRLLSLTAKVNAGAFSRVSAERSSLSVLSHRLDVAAAQYLEKKRKEVEELASSIRRLSHEKVGRQSQWLARYSERMARATEQIFRQAHLRHEAIERAIRLADPVRVLSLGFSITFKDGKPVRDAANLPSGTHITTRLAHGTVESVVE